MQNGIMENHIGDLKSEKQRFKSVPRGIKQKKNLLENISVR
jgi:hypothetical protein